MFRLLNIELHKLKHSRASKVLILTYFLLLTSIALVSAISFDFGFTNFNLSEQGVFNFPYIWHLNTYLASGFKFFLLLVIVSMMANEYSNRTLKQNLIDGLSKKEFVLSKFYTVILFALVSTVFVGIISLVLGLIYSDYNELAIIVTDLDYLLAYFVKLVGFFSFGLFFGVFVKRSAFAVGALLSWYFAELIIMGLLKWKIDSDTLYESITQFLPFNALSNLIKEPFSRFNAVKSIASQLGEEVTKDFSVQPKDLLIVIIWTGLFIYWSYLLIKKRDL